MDASVAYAVEQMSGLRVESGLVEGSQLRAARKTLLETEGIPAMVKAVADQDALAAQITAVLEHKQPVASRLVRVHQYYWLRLWLESGTKVRPAICLEAVKICRIASFASAAALRVPPPSLLPGDKSFIFIDLEDIYDPKFVQIKDLWLNSSA